jgi:hypothetical protein
MKKFFDIATPSRYIAKCSQSIAGFYVTKNSFINGASIRIAS